MTMQRPNTPAPAPVDPLLPVKCAFRFSRSMESNTN